MKEFICLIAVDDESMCRVIAHQLFDGSIFDV